jgi:hypothetical protein
LNVQDVELPRINKNEADRITALIKEKLDFEMLRPTMVAAFGREAPIVDFVTEEPEKFEAILKGVKDLLGVMMSYHAEELLEDIKDGLQSDVESAVQVAFNHGAVDWARLNYPSWMERLEGNKRAAEERRQC